LTVDRSLRRGRTIVLAAVVVLVLSVATLSSQGQGGGFVAYPERRPGDPAAIERGRAIYGVNCVFCHGTDARGGDGGGPNLLRSSLVLEDMKGERIGPVLREGRPGMPPFQFPDAQVLDLAEFLHSFPVSSRTGPSKIDILTGDPEKGRAYVAARCASCHTIAALTTFADKLDDPKMLQQMWIMPGNAGGRGGGPAPIPQPPISVTVTLPSGESFKGRLSRVDDFAVSLTDTDGTHRTFRLTGTKIKVEIHDPLAPHKELLRVYTDADIHNVTAYLALLRSR
jgi:mono/diheme cytochrome c family protein